MECAGEGVTVPAPGSCEYGLWCEQEITDPLTGSTVPGSIVSETAIMKVMFVSDSVSSVRGLGFAASYATERNKYLPPCGDVVFTTNTEEAVNGYIEFLPPAPRPEYANDQYCEWNIVLPDTFDFSFTFPTFSTDVNDVVEVSSCTNADATDEACVIEAALFSQGGTA
eukprot:2046566-Rhodomonas_salina.1